MQEMTTQEVEVVGGALSMEAGGMAIMAIGVAAIVVASPVIAFGAVGIGAGLLIAHALAQ